MYLMRKRKDNKVPFEDMEYEDWVACKVGYWRKANAIHKWFVDKVQNGIDDCSYYLVNYKNIQELKDICDKILQDVIARPGKVKNGETYNHESQKWEPNWENGKEIVNKELCEQLLPTQDGFFFGSTDYDEFYLDDVKLTSEILEKVLKETDFENEEIYYSSSW